MGSGISLGQPPPEGRRLPGGSQCLLVESRPGPALGENTVQTGLFRPIIGDPQTMGQHPVAHRRDSWIEIGVPFAGEVFLDRLQDGEIQVLDVRKGVEGGTARGEGQFRLLGEERSQLGGGHMRPTGSHRNQPGQGGTSPPRGRIGQQTPRGGEGPGVGNVGVEVVARNAQGDEVLRQLVRV
ncbi:hypothetical protein QQY66_48040 [Streptomyces sp. DG2A-72]|uniref:hypothetical protein n=1 Tax=Streptomyces sp. DG2A-72 TaxID=3051386 RepID=UPI00265C80AE|nr:hypothetical protein [Streptomyces sp. DG2A-72]MDO0939086.1 hypothetical protein [Streptomyces sp. DG2A-72]